MSIEHYLNKEKKGGCLMIYRKIIKYCEENNISIAALEKKCNIGNGTIGKWEKGGKPSLDTLEKISKVTGITVSELVSN
jgi:transcriptional regulator with XRE-family HTH domain